MTAFPPAESAHLMILPEAAAVLGVSRWMSTRGELKVLGDYVNESLRRAGVVNWNVIPGKYK
jgi:hypothetical protein